VSALTAGVRKRAAGVLNRSEGSAVHDEQALVEAARSDRQAFGRLYDRYFDSIYNYIYRRVGDLEAAEDLTSATWERALVAIGRYETRGLPFGAWLFRIAGNLVANYHRERAAHRQVPLDTAPLVGAEFSLSADDRNAVHAALGQLSDSDQEILGLVYFAELPPPEIAAVLGCSAAAVHKRLHRARIRLRERYEDHSSERAPGTLP
jgi:RNA polymerase sigma-70 factor, ECF subfamily